MKFAKLLSSATDMPSALPYKLLKKQLKQHLQRHNRSSPKGGMRRDQTEADSSGDEQTVTRTLAKDAVLSEREEAMFVRALNEELARLNQHFIDEEEVMVIRLQSLSEERQHVTTRQQRQQLKSALVKFHGEVVLLLHWSLLNFAAVVKILKKHDKRTGLLLRAPYLATVLQQPFYSTNIMSRLLKEAEDHIAALSEEQTPGSPSLPSVATPPIVSEAAVDPTMLRRTQNALETWHTLSKTASTPSTVLELDSARELLRNLEMSRSCSEEAGAASTRKRTSEEAFPSHNGGSR